MTDALTCPQCGSELPSNAPAGMCPRCLMQAALSESSDENQSPAYAETTPQPRSFLPPESGVLANHFPHLEILELLGQGGMGAVYKARQPQLDRLVALKIIRPESADDPTFAERFNREAKTLARLSHPNIVAVHDFGEVTLTEGESAEKPKTLYYFLMEYVDGANLRQLMDREDLSPDQALSIVPQICDALQFAHDEGIVHRDIKPENILIDSRGRVKIADFGLAKLASASEQDFTLTGTHQVMGTPRYMAPEQMAGSRSVDHRADLYSLGVVFYEMLTGQIPAGIFDPPSGSVSIDARLDDVIMKTLAQKPEDRFQKASEIRASLQAIVQDESGAVISEPETSDLPPARGFSTIFEREAVAAWNWVIQPDRNTRTSEQTETAAFPRLLFITLAVLGGLTIFLPWAILDIEKGAEITLTVSDDSSTLAAPISESFRGTEIWSSSAAAGACFLVALVLILTPHRRSPGWISVALMSALSIAAAVLTFTYPNELNSGAYVEFRAEVTPETANWLKPEKDFAEVPAEDGDVVPREVISHTLSMWAFSDRVQFREGYFGALGISVTLVLLNIIAVRNLMLYREPQSETSESWSGTPLASLRFTVLVKGEIGSKIRFHFLGLGYELEKEQPGTWIFQRGTVMGGMMQSDIRAYPTRLSIHAIEEHDGSHLVNCHWSVRLMGGWAGKKDIKLLEDEGRELQTLLGGPVDRPKTAAVTPPPAEVNLPQDNVPGPAGAARVGSADKEAVGPKSISMDLAAVEDEVRGPAIAMMVVGLLMIIGHVIAIPVIFEVTRSDDFIWTVFPGMVIGMAILAGGIGLQGLRSRGWTQVGLIAGFLPATPAWPFTLMLSSWISNVLSKPQVKMGFAERRHRQREEVKRWSSDSAEAGAAIDLLEVEDEVSGPAIAMVAIGALLTLGNAVWAVTIFQPGPWRDEMAVFCLPGMLIGLAMLIGGLCMKGLGSRGWAQMGAIAGMIPLHPGWILALPTGIWALVTLRRPKIRRAFLERARQRRNPAARKETLSATGSPPLDMIDIEEAVSSPAIAMIVVGILMIIGHGIAVGICLSTPWDREMAWIGVPGLIVGLGMLIGGINLKRLRSRGWAQLGIIAGYLPAGPGWLLSFPICLWAHKTLGTEKVRQAFRERTRHRRVQPSPQSTLLRPATLITLLTWSAVVIIGGMVTYAWLRGELSEFHVADSRAGTLVPKSGAYEQVTVTARGTAKSQLMLDLDREVKRTQLEFQLTPLKYARYEGGTGLLEIELPSLGWHAPLRDGTEIGSPAGLTPDAVQEWMGLSGVDPNVEGVAEEARALFAIAEYAHQKPPHELIDESLFTVQPGGPNQVRVVTDRYQEWQHARYCLYIWLGGVVIFLLVTVPRRETAPHSFGRTLVQFATMIMILCGASYLLYLAGGSWSEKIPRKQPEWAEKPLEPQVDDENPRSALHDAAAVGQISRFRRLLADVKADINDKDSQGKTPLMYAAENNQTSTVLALIVMGANINETDPDGRNAVMLAADKGHADLIQALKDLENFAAICHRDDATPEQAAEKFKEFPGIDRRLLEEINPRALKFEVPLDAQDKQGMTVAMIAAANGDSRTLEILWSLGGIKDKNRQDHQGRTLLMHAMLNDHPDLVLRFLDRFVKTDPGELSPVDQQGRSLYSMAEERGATEVTDRMRQLLTEEVESYKKMVESQPGYETHLEKLLKALATMKAPVADPAEKIQSPSDSTQKLFEAVAAGDAGRVKQLLKSGAGINDKNDTGLTPLMAAAMAGETQMVAMLMLRGADETLRDYEGKSALMHAVEGGHAATVEMLIDMKSANSDEEFQFRLKRIDPETTEKLDFSTLRFQSGEDWQDKAGETALMKAADRGDLETFTKLLPWSDGKLRDEAGRTALLHAVEKGQVEFLTKLLEQAEQQLAARTPGHGFVGAVTPELLSLGDDQGRTPLALAEATQLDALATRLRSYLQTVVSTLSREIANGSGSSSLSSTVQLRGHAFVALGDKARAETDFEQARQLQAAGKDSSLARSVALHEAVRLGDAGLAKELLDAGASVNDKDSEGRTPLMLAAANGHASLAATLLLLGANVNEKDKQGLTPMMYAVEKGHEPVRKAIEEVVSASRYSEKKDRIEKLTRLPGIDKRLIEGIEIDVETIKLNPLAQDINGETVLMKAVKSQNFAYLRDAKYNQGAAKTFEVAPLQDEQGRTALMYAIELKDPDYLRRIYDVAHDYVYMDNMYNANTFVGDYQVNPMFDPRALCRANKDGLTALQLAEKLGQDDTAKLIRDEMQRFVEIATRAIESEVTKTKYQSLWLSWLNLRGQAYLALGEEEKAEADFQQAKQPPAEN